MKKVIFLFLLISLLGLNSYAQQHSLMVQYMFNRLVFNPAYAGSNEGISGSLWVRKQWINFDHAPFVTQLSVDGLMTNNKVGLGLVVANDKAGELNRTDLYGNYAYRLSVGGESVLAFGLRGGVSYYSLNNVRTWDQGDEAFNVTTSGIMPKIGAGLYYDNPVFYIGLSIPDLIQYDPNGIFKDNQGKSWRAPKDVFITGGYNLYVNDLVTLIPSALFRYSAIRTLVDLNVNMVYADKYIGGIVYRINNAYALLGQIVVKENLRVGFAYEYPQFNLKIPTWGSVEFMLAYGLK